MADKKLPIEFRPGVPEINPQDRSVFDARGRALQVGDEVLVIIPGPFYFRIAAIEPVLNPNAPLGLSTVHLGCLLAFHAQKGQPHMEFLRVRTAQEAGPNTFSLDPNATKSILDDPGKARP